VGDTSIDAGCVHLDQYLGRRDPWPIDGAHLEHVGRAVPVLDDRTHPQMLALARRSDARAGPLSSPVDRSIHVVAASRAPRSARELGDNHISFKLHRRIAVGGCRSVDA
jgi:hypothetical protein